MKQSDQDQLDSVAFNKAFGHILQRPAARESEFDMDTSSCEDATNLEKAMTAKAAKKTVSKTMRSINAIQLARLDKLIHFKRRDKKLLYVDGMLKNDDSEKVWFNCLKRTDDKLAKIVRKPEKRSIDSDRSYPRSLTTEFGATLDEHSVLDLFQTACKIAADIRLLQPMSDLRALPVWAERRGRKHWRLHLCLIACNIEI